MWARALLHDTKRECVVAASGASSVVPRQMVERCGRRAVSWVGVRCGRGWPGGGARRTFPAASTVFSEPYDSESESEGVSRAKNAHRNGKPSRPERYRRAASGATLGGSRRPDRTVSTAAVGVKTSARGGKGGARGWARAGGGGRGAGDELVAAGSC